MPYFLQLTEYEYCISKFNFLYFMMALERI